METATESRDTVCFEFSDLTCEVDTTVRPAGDEVVKYLLRRYLLQEKNLVRCRDDLPRMLDLSRQQEASCLQNKDLWGAARCQANQGLLFAAQGKLNEALEKQLQAAEIFRHLQDIPELILSLLRQADLWRRLQCLEKALVFATEACQLAVQHNQEKFRDDSSSLVERIQRQMNGEDQGEATS